MALTKKTNRLARQQVITPWQAALRFATRWGIAAALLLVVGSLVACNGPSTSDTDGNSSQQTAANPDDYPKLARALFDLAVADQPSDKAKQLELPYEDGLVQIVVEVK